MGVLFPKDMAKRPCGMRGLTSRPVGVLIASGIIFAGYSDFAYGGHAPRIASYLLGTAMVVWLVARAVRVGWRLPVVLGAVTLAGFLWGRSAGARHRDQRILAESGEYQRVAVALAARTVNSNEPILVEKPMRGTMFAVVSTDPDTGGVAVRFAFDDTSRRSGVIVFVGAHSAPVLKKKGFCLRPIKDALYQYDVCD